MFDDLVACSEKLNFHLGDGFIRPSIQLLGDEAKEVLVEKGLCSAEQMKYIEVMLVAGTIPVSYYESLALSNGFDALVATRVVGREEFTKHVSDLLVLANVASVGAIELSYSLLLQDEQSPKIDVVPRMDGDSLQFAVTLAEKIDWPPLSTVKFEKVWNWSKGRFPFLDGFDDCPLSRALAAFSRLQERLAYGEPMQLVWALIGLEALYCQSNVELGQQLREKVQVFLGRQESCKKIVKKIYALRAKLYTENKIFRVFTYCVMQALHSISTQMTCMRPLVSRLPC
jgi:hypothetical protein